MDSLERPSKKVYTNQQGLHKDLLEIIKRYNITSFKRPIPQRAHDNLKNILSWLGPLSLDDVILDLGCGVGESTYHIAIDNPGCAVIGIDKSASRINRNNQYKKNAPVNMYLLREDVIDIIRLIYTTQELFRVKKIYILYPNPWPKANGIKKRWHGNPIFAFLMSFTCEIEVRSNWKNYLDEFSVAASTYHKKCLEVDSYTPEKIVTPFERKYLNSSHTLFRLIVLASE